MMAHCSHTQLKAELKINRCVLMAHPSYSKLKTKLIKVDMSYSTWRMNCL